jgi:DNA-binding NarL/FixJ family response regulator
MRPAGLTVSRSRILPPGKPAGRSAAAPWPAGGPRRKSSERRSRTLKRLRVLIVDDQRDFAEAVRSLLSTDDRIEVVGEARNGEEAVELAAVLAPDLIVMDLDMPVMNGVEATRVLSKRDGVLVLLLTGSDSASDIALARNAGASGFVRKGSDTGDLLARVLALGERIPA